MKITAVIMAGGRGERFWPKSRNTLPKQFLSLTADGETMIQKTVNRLRPIVDINDIFVVTNASYIDLVSDQIADMPKENILAEPCARNTAPCIALAGAVINKKYDDAVMLVLPSDHLIGYEDLYLKTLKKAIKTAQIDENLVTIGITPTYPETGYGYIKFVDDGTELPNDAYKVDRFVEKPDLETAKKYVVSEKYLWNSGMFVWKVSAIMNSLKTYMPDIYEGALNIKDACGTDKFDEVLEKEFTAFRSESIDFGIMEKADDIYTISGSFGWDDVGSWLAVERINDVDNNKNYIEGNVISIGTERSTICGKNRLIAAVGVEDLIVVDTDDAILICSKNNTQDVKKVIEELKKQGKTELI